jgi:predicted nucleic acid-binding protein
VILVDTCVWIDHLRRVDPALTDLLEQSDVCTHPMVIGELALGSLRRRAEVLELVQTLPRVMPAGHDEVLLLVEREGLVGAGLSLVDVHLLATVRINPGVALWTRDKRLRSAATNLGAAAPTLG